MALQNGYRHIDTAMAYRNEREVGQGIAESGVPRDDIFVTTKLWQGGYQGEPVLSKAQVKAAFAHELDIMGLEQLDLYLIHGPFGGHERLAQWEALLELKAEGKVRAVGVSNYNISHLEEIRLAGLELPEVNQIELHPWSQKPSLVAYLREHAILPVAYSSLAPLSNWRGSAVNMSGKGDQRSDVFKRYAEKYGVSEAQFLLRWGIDSGYPVLPKSLHSERQKENLAILNFRISDEDLEALKKEDRGSGFAWGDDPTLAQ